MPSKSTGGWISCTNVRAKTVYGLFDNVLTQEDRLKSTRYRLIAIRNEYDFAIRDVRLYVSFKFHVEERLLDVERTDGRTDAERVGDYLSIKALGIKPIARTLDAISRATNKKQGYDHGYGFASSSDELTNLYGDHNEIPDFSSRIAEDGSRVITSELPIPITKLLEPNEYYGISFELNLNTNFINRGLTEEELLAVRSHPPEHPFDSNVGEIAFMLTAHPADTMDPPQVSSPNI